MLAEQLLQPQPLGQCRGQQQAGVGNELGNVILTLKSYVRGQLVQLVAYPQLAANKIHEPVSLFFDLILLHGSHPCPKGTTWSGGHTVVRPQDRQPVANLFASLARTEELDGCRRLFDLHPYRCQSLQPWIKIKGSPGIVACGFLHGISLLDHKSDVTIARSQKTEIGLLAPIAAPPLLLCLSPFFRTADGAPVGEEATDRRADQARTACQHAGQQRVHRARRYHPAGRPIQTAKSRRHREVLLLAKPLPG